MCTLNSDKKPRNRRQFLPLTLLLLPLAVAPTHARSTQPLLETTAQLVRGGPHAWVTTDNSVTEGRTHCRTSLGHSMLAIGSPAGWIAKDAGAPALAGSAAEDGVELTANLQRRTETDGTSSGTAGLPIPMSSRMAPVHSSSRQKMRDWRRT